MRVAAQLYLVAMVVRDVWQPWRDPVAHPETPETPETPESPEADPRERVNLAPGRPELVSELKAQLTDIQNGATSTAVRMSADEEKLIKARLEALGYVE